jgi:glutamate mutase epsilon subunit
MSEEQNIVIEQAHKLLKLKDKKAILDQELKELNELYEKEEKDLFDMMFNLDLELMRLDGRTLSRKIEEYPRIIDKNRFFTWLRENGFADLIKEVINDRTLRSWFKENRDGIPEEIIMEHNAIQNNIEDVMLQVYKDKKISIRKSNK